MNEIKKINDKIKECQEQIDWCYDNYSGCDWCCGHGDEEVEDLYKEILRLEHKRKVTRLRFLQLNEEALDVTEEELLSLRTQALRD